MARTLMFARPHFSGPLLVFLLTLLPFGFGHTRFGDEAAYLVMMTIGLGLLFAGFLQCIRPALPLARLHGGARWVMALRRPHFLMLVGVMFLLMSLFHAWWIYDFAIVVQDSAAQYVHAKFFAAGRLTGPVPEMAEFFAMKHVLMHPHWYSQYPPGHTALIAVGHLLHAPWLVNPLLGAGTCLGVYFLARETHSERIARVAALLCVVSTMMLYMSAEYMNHATSGCFTVLAMLAFVRWLKVPGCFYAGIAGVCWGMVFLTRPLTALGVAGAVMATLFVTRSLTRRHWLTAFTAVIPPVGAVIIQLLYNYATTGEYWTFGYVAAWGRDHIPQFGAVPAGLVAETGADIHTLWKGIGNAFNNLNGLSFFMFSWPFPTFMLTAASLLLLRKYPHGRVHWFLLVGLLGVHIPYFWQDYCFGPRYLYEAVPGLIILTAAALYHFPALLRVAAGWKVRHMEVLAGCVLASLCGVALLQPTIGRSADNCVPEYSHPLTSALLQELRHVLVFVPKDDYYFYAWQAPYSGRENITFACDLGAQNVELMRRYPDREAFRLSMVAKYKIQLEPLPTPQSP